MVSRLAKQVATTNRRARDRGLRWLLLHSVPFLVRQNTQR